MLLLEEVKAWLQAAPRSVVEPITLDAQPADPNTLVTLSDSGGLALEADYGIDNPTVQVRCRGPTATIARNLAFRVDALLLDQEGGFLMGATRVVGIGRLGGRPAVLDVDERGRTTYVCNYWIKSKR